MFTTINRIVHLMRLFFPLFLILLLRVNVLGQNYNIYTFAGGGEVPSNVPATSVNIPYIHGIAVDASRNSYVPARNAVLRVNAISGQLARIAGTELAGFMGDNGPATSAELNAPQGVAVDASGDVYIADSGNNVIRKVSNGVITTVAGTGYGAGQSRGGYSGDNGPATSAELNWPTSVAVDTAGNMYVADSGNNVIRKVSNGVITTVAGTGYGAGQSRGGYSGDNGPATSAELSAPQAVAVDAAGNMYIADSGNNVIRKISNGVITTIVGDSTQGYSGDGNPATSAELFYPVGLAVNASGEVYIADCRNNVIRKISNGVITTFAGKNRSGTGPLTRGRLGDSGPAATSVELDWPVGVTVDASGNVYIADSGNNVIRKVSNGVITTIAGGGPRVSATYSGPATSAELDWPAGVAVDAAGNLYISDSGNELIRKVSNDLIATIAGTGYGARSNSGLSGYSGDNGLATSAELNVPQAVAADTLGNAYVADSQNFVIRKISDSVITTIAGNGSWGYSGDGGPATNAKLRQPFGVAVDASGDVYIADSGNNVIRKVSNGMITTIAGGGLRGGATYSGPASSAQLLWPMGVAVDASGNVYIADSGNNVIRKVSNGMITTIAGNGTGGYSGDNGTTTAAALNSPMGVTVDASGNVYVADSGNNVIRKVSNGMITTIAGNGTGGYSADCGPATSAELYWPTAVAVDAAGNVYIADSGNGVIRILVP